jgi:hypothetical protein
VVATLLLNQRSEVVQPYLQSARVMAKSAVLWVMFLACMATSVFFSFDSLFTSIFPQDQRARAAEIRSSRQVAAVVADIGVLAQRRQGEEAEQLFRSRGWADFERNLDGLSRAAQGAELEIERYFVEQMETHRRGIAEQQERVASAVSGQAGLVARKATLTDELSRLKAERPGLASDLAEKRTELDARNRALDGKRVEAMAEERGAEGTLKAGKGPVYRQRMGELAQMQDAIKIQQERVRDAERRLQATDTRLSQIGRELAAVDGDIAKLKGEASTAEQRIAAAESTKAPSSDAPRVDPARVRGAFERARADFRQGPTAERLTALAAQCAQLYGALPATPATKERVRAIDCNPQAATEAAANVFALNAGLVAFAQRCVGGDSLPKSGGTDALLEHGRKCLQDSGLPSRDSGDMGARISAIDLNRDDKAHRFVVTWNAFTDGNRLAYLALAIAIAIDGLVFLSGLFGANAVRSPLTEIEDRGEMTADQLEAIIDAALQDTAHPRATLQTILGALHPIAGQDGFTSELVLEGQDEDALQEVRRVLNAARTIGAVRPVGSARTHYQLHYGLVRYLGISLKQAPKLNREHVDRKELVNVVGVALLPDPQANAEAVLAHLEPISDSDRYSAETYPFRIDDPAERRLVLNTLGAGATVPGTVEREDATGRYLVSTDFYKTLLLMRAAAIPAFRPEVVKARYAIASLSTERSAQPSGREPALVAEPVARITDQTQRSAGEAPPDAPAPAASAAREAQSDGAPPGPPPLPPMPPEWARAQPVASADSEDPSLGGEIRADLIHIAGLHPWTDREMAIVRQLGEGSEAEQALRRLEGRAPHLWSLVEQTIAENREALAEAHEELKAHKAGEAMYLQVLETVVSELDTLMPVLMLTPAGPYQQLVGRLIEALEAQAGEGKLGAGETMLLGRLRYQRTSLNRLSDGAADRYARVVRIMDQYDERVSASPLPLAEARLQRRSAR